MTKTQYFEVPGGIKYFFKYSAAIEPKANICIVHGYADHSGRFDHVAEYFQNNGFNIFSFDLRGHGKSSGKKVYIHSFDNYIEDITVMLNYFFEHFNASKKPTFIYSHSMGTLISLYYLINHQSQFAGWISTGGLIKPNEDISPILVKLSGLLSALTPSLRSVRLDLKDLSRNPETKSQAENDPLYDHGGIRARTGKELLKATKHSNEVIDQINLPLLIFHGAADKLSQPEGSQQLYDLSASLDKTLKFWPEAFHELVNEPNRFSIMDEMLIWLQERI